MLEKEALIIARLKDTTISKVADLAKHVISSAAIAGSVDLAPYCPAVIVHPGASPMFEQSIDKKAATETQNWLIVVAVKFKRDNGLDETYSALASDLMTEVAKCLSGWTPDDWSNPMGYLGREEPDLQPGFAQFPMNFEILNEFQAV